MTKDEVKALETATQVSKNPEDLIYSVKVQQKETILQYEFNDADQLFRAGYIFRPNYLNFNEYVEDFNQLEAAYLDKYKEPSIERTDKWSNSLFKGSPESLGTAVAMSYCEIATKWTPDDTKLTLLLYGSNMKVTAVAVYESTTVDPPSKDTSDI